jgi:hypothetical protein
MAQYKSNAIANAVQYKKRQERQKVQQREKDIVHTLICGAKIGKAGEAGCSAASG